MLPKTEANGEFAEEIIVCLRSPIGCIARSPATNTDVKSSIVDSVPRSKLASCRKHIVRQHCSRCHEVFQHHMQIQVRTLQRFYTNLVLAALSKGLLPHVMSALVGYGTPSTMLRQMAGSGAVKLCPLMDRGMPYVCS